MTDSALRERVAELEAKLKSIRARPGRDGRDGKQGPPGSQGLPGRDGEPCDMVAVESVVAAKAGEIEARIRIPVDGKDGAAGKDGRDGIDGKDGRDGKHGIDGLVGKQGEVGARGPAGPTGPTGPMGPMPRHQWDGTRLRFEREADIWGKWTDLKGPPGKDGTPGGTTHGGIVMGPPISSGGSGNNYFPGGWT